jgi:hypothetical protein
MDSNAVGIAVDEKHRRFDGLELVGAEVERFHSFAATRLTQFGNSSGVGLTFLYPVSTGEPLKFSDVSCGNMSSASLTQPSWRNEAEMLTTLLTFSGWRIAHYIATPPPML